MYHRERRTVNTERALFAALAALATLSLASVGCIPPATEQAMSLSRQHRDDEGIKLLRAELGKHPGDLAARRLLIRMLAVESDMNGARAEVLALRERLPEGDPSPSIELGHALELTHQFEEALRAYDEAASLAPASPAGPLEGGTRCARWGEVEEARPRLEEAVRRGARDGETYHLLGLVLVKLGDLEAAEQAYRAGAAADPKGAENWLGLATVAVIRNDGAAALTAYDQILARHASYGAAQLGRAWALARLGRKDEARRALDRATELGAPALNIARQRAALAADAAP
jgi:Flp pilus assembly protein TadD